MYQRSQVDHADGFPFSFLELPHRRDQNRALDVRQVAHGVLHEPRGAGLAGAQPVAVDPEHSRVDVDGLQHPVVRAQNVHIIKFDVNISVPYALADGYLSDQRNAGYRVIFDDA